MQADCKLISQLLRLWCAAVLQCLERAIEAVKPGMRYRDLGRIISQHAQGNG